MKVSTVETIPRVLSFDPGLAMCGWSILDHKAGNVIVTRFGTIAPNRLTDLANQREQVNHYGRRLISLNFLRDMVIALIEEHKPQYIVAEDAYFDPTKPNAFIALLQWLSTVEMLVFKQYGLPLYKIPSKTAKLIVSGNGGCSKDNVQDALFAHSDIVFKQQKQTDKLTSHEADAIAIGYAFLSNILPALVGK